MSLDWRDPSVLRDQGVIVTEFGVVRHAGDRPYGPKKFSMCWGLYLNSEEDAWFIRSELERLTSVSEKINGYLRRHKGRWKSSCEDPRWSHELGDDREIWIKDWDLLKNAMLHHWLAEDFDSVDAA